jgi:hypothetical protein
VIVHGQLCEVSKLLIQRVMRELLFLVVQDLLDCYRHIDGFSLGGMLQVYTHFGYVVDLRIDGCKFSVGYFGNRVHSSNFKKL